MQLAARNANESEGKCLTPDDVISEVLADLSPMRPRCIEGYRDGKCYVYFIGGDGTPVKIGLSNAPYERLASLQTAHWVKLSILAKVEGGLAAESAYHRQFAAHRLHGEWFERVPEIEAEIARLASIALATGLML